MPAIVRAILGSVLAPILAVLGFSSIAVGQSPEALISQLPQELQTSIRIACNSALIEGPAPYIACLRRHMAALDQQRGTPPDISRLSQELQTSIRIACNSALIEGPAPYIACLRRHMAALDEKPPQRSTESGPAGLNKAPLKSAAPDPRTMKAQILLHSLGYDVGVADGFAGPRTRGAIQSYQALRGLEVDGAVNPQLLAALENDLKSKPITSVPQPPKQPNSEIAPGSSAPRPIISPGSPDTSLQPDDRNRFHKYVGRASGPMPHRTSDSVLPPPALFEASKHSVWIVIAAASVDMLREHGAQGSAIAISQHELITNCHVVEGQQVIGLMQGTTVLPAQLSSALPSRDRCVLKVTSSLVPVRAIRAFSDLKVGEKVYTIGAPRGLERTLGEGLISGLRTGQHGNLIQTTAPISPGSSGGGLFDERGNLIGITTFLLKDSQGLNFAISADEYWR